MYRLRDCALPTFISYIRDNCSIQKENDVSSSSKLISLVSALHSGIPVTGIHLMPIDGKLFPLCGSEIFNSLEAAFREESGYALDYHCNTLYYFDKNHPLKHTRIPLNTIIDTAKMGKLLASDKFKYDYPLTIVLRRFHEKLCNSRVVFIEYDDFNENLIDKLILL